MMKMAKTGLVISALSLAIVAGALPVEAGSDVGVTAAVNPQAKSTLPSGRVRTVVLGGKVVFKEKIDTAGTGLVQILFTDGSSLTVGANASLVIDQYVYNPANGTGKLAVSFGKGVMRFVGGKLSKNRGGVSIRTTVGTAGIRGGMANIAISGNRGVFSLLFGYELSLDCPDGQRRRIYQPGYTLVVEKQRGKQLCRFETRRTQKGDTAFFQNKLAGKPGHHGGARRGPTERFVAGGPLPPHNSDLPPGRNKPHDRPQTVLASPPTELESGLLDLSNAFDPITDDQGGTITIDPGVADPGDPYGGYGECSGPTGAESGC